MCVKLAIKFVVPFTEMIDIMYVYLQIGTWNVFLKNYVVRNTWQLSVILPENTLEIIL